MTLLLVILALLVGFFFGVYSIMNGLKKRFPATWKTYLREHAAHARANAEAYDKEARP